MKVSIAFLLSVLAKAVDSNAYKYIAYISKFGKSHATIQEFNMRLENFLVTDTFIQEWNSDPSNTSTLGHNAFSDWTTDEKSKLHGTRVESDS
jgi:hypothetical protein